MSFPERVQVIKQESTALGGDDADSGPAFQYPIDPFEDVIEAAGFELQEPDDVTRTRDNDVIISRATGEMTFKDQVVTSAVTLTALLAGGTGVTYTEFLLENDPTAETGTPDATYIVTYSGANPTKEEWKRDDATLIKSIDYTYTSKRVTQLVVKVFAANGTTILAQVTWDITYTAGKLDGGSMTRNV